MRNLITVIVITWAVGFTSAALGQGVDMKRFNEEGQVRLQRLLERFNNPVSLEADIGAYMDFVEEGTQPFFDLLTRHYSREAIFDEMVRQARARKSDRLLGLVLVVASHAKNESVKQLAVGGLTAQETYRQYACRWCWKNKDRLSPEEHQRAVKAYRAAFFESKGEQCYPQMLECAREEDVPAIKTLYSTVCRRKALMTESGEGSIYTCHGAFSSMRTTRAEILLLLANLGEPEAVQEIRTSIAQDKDVQRRAWGILLAVRWRHNKSVMPLIVKTLDDKRQVPERVGFGADPEVHSSRAFRTLYTRVCDVAVRAIHQIDPPTPPWPFLKVLAIKHWRVWPAFADTSFDFKQELGKGWELLNEHTTVKVVNRRVILGFTDDQIEYARRYAARRKRS